MYIYICIYIYIERERERDREIEREREIVLSVDGTEERLAARRLAEMLRLYSSTLRFKKYIKCLEIVMIKKKRLYINNCVLKKRKEEIHHNTKDKTLNQTHMYNRILTSACTSSTKYIIIYCSHKYIIIYYKIINI